MHVSLNLPGMLGTQDLEGDVMEDEMMREELDQKGGGDSSGMVAEDQMTY